MSDNKIMIRFYFGLFLVLALLAYTVDLNSQFHFVALNTPFISNLFCNFVWDINRCDCCDGYGNQAIFTT